MHPLLSLKIGPGMIDSMTKGNMLIALARAAITTKLDMHMHGVDCSGADWLEESAATFVTLSKHGELRGCIGTLEAYRPLIEDVQANAIAAAFHDPRFLPLSREEYSSLQVEVSLLSSMQAIDAGSERIALSNIRPFIDGVVFKYGSYRSTFLPQVWEQLPDPVQFMAHLKQKAGLSADFWHPDVIMYKYQVYKYHE